MFIKKSLAFLKRIQWYAVIKKVIKFVINIFRNINLSQNNIIKYSEWWLTIIECSFEKHEKWTFLTTTDEEITAKIADKKFIDQILKHEKLFGSGDMLLVDIQIHTQPTLDGSLCTEYIIKKVLEHRVGFFNE